MILLQGYKERFNDIKYLPGVFNTIDGDYKFLYI